MCTKETGFTVVGVCVYNFMCTGVLPVSMSVHHVCLTPQRPSDPLKLELQIVVSCHTLAETQTQACVRAVSVFNS